jgi:hypothetical protein
VIIVPIITVALVLHHRHHMAGLRGEEEATVIQIHPVEEGGRMAGDRSITVD